MNYEIHIKQLPDSHVVTKRTHTPIARIGDAMSSALAGIAGAVSPRGAARGVPFAIYHNEPFTPDDVDVELGVPIAADAVVAPPAGTVKNLPGGSFAYTMHVGSYASIGAAYGALFGWLEAHGLRAKGPPRESYIVGPGQNVQPSEYRTELAVPVE